MNPVRSQWLIPSLIFLGMLGAIALGTWGGFPVFDDACLYLVGPGEDQLTVAEVKASRPIYGFMLQRFMDTFALNQTPYVIFNVAFWILLAWQTYRLSIRLFESKHTAVLSALMVLSPIIVKTHFTTITIWIPAYLPLSICLAALLLSLRNNTNQNPILLVLIVVLTFAAAVLSEYGVATAAASIALLLVLRRPRPAIAILVGAILGFWAFQNIGDFSHHIPRVASKQVEIFLHKPAQIMFNLILGLWTSLVGSYGAAASSIPLQAGTRSTILAFIAAIFSAILIKKWFQSSDENPDETRKLIALFFAAVAGLLPVVYANESPASGDSYETRYFIPILPFAVIATVRCALNIFHQRFRPWLAALFIFIAVSSVCNGAFDVMREQKRMEAIGESLKSYVRESEGITIVAVPNFQGMDGTDITPKVSKQWPQDLARRVWVLPLKQSVELFGSRTECRNTSWFELKDTWSRRRGSVSHLFYLPTFWEPLNGSPTEHLEQYCVTLASSRHVLQ